VVAARSAALLALALQGRCLRHPMPGTWQRYSLAGAEQAAAGPRHRHDPRTAAQSEGWFKCVQSDKKASADGAWHEPCG